MRKDLTDITVVLDRSGSMVANKTETENGLNAFIKDQASKPGDANFTLVKFDDKYECPIVGLPIKEVGRCTLEPRNWTALNDAVARAIEETGERLSAIPESQRPGVVVFVIVTDGYENRSVKYPGHAGRAKVREMIEHQREKYQWQFTYLGSNQDAFAEAVSLGIPAESAANYIGTRADMMWQDGVSNNVGRMRAAGLTGAQVVNSYTAVERKSMEAPPDPARAAMEAAHPSVPGDKPTASV